MVSELTAKVHLTPDQLHHVELAGGRVFVFGWHVTEGDAEKAADAVLPAPLHPVAEDAVRIFGYAKIGDTDMVHQEVHQLVTDALAEAPALAATLLPLLAAKLPADAQSVIAEALKLVEAVASE